MSPPRTNQFVCDCCQKVYSRKDRLKVHMRSHTGENNLKCEVCNKVFYTSYAFSHHQKIHSGVKEFKCQLCKKEFVRNDHLKRHLLRHSVQGKPFRCEICSAGFKAKETLKKHLKTTHDPGYSHKFHCTFCSKSFIWHREFQCHILSHIQERPYFCKQCPDGFQNKSILQRHLRIHNPLRERHLECDLCAKRFSAFSSLRMHISAHLGEKQFKCESCTNEFLTLSELERHVLRIHTDAKKIPCSFCEKRFKTNSELLQHFATHTNEKIYQYPCKTCHKKFSQKRTLKLHTQLYCRGDQRTVKRKPFPCHICKTGYSRKYALKDHLKYFHNSTYNLRRTCVFCDRLFVTKFGFEDHVRKHIDENPMLCKLCNAEFRNKLQLNLHLIREHSVRNGLYECGVCQKGFLWRDHLIRHNLKHEIKH